MFYSHTYLARKGPLGTVWMAAHLQHKLRKSHVSVTDIPSTVDSIMFPEVPIALRLSAFLLLGVVRIYSKKVEYLYYDCNEVLTHIRTAFAALQDVNLPENAASAPFHSVTLPETFELDALNIDDDLYLERSPDNHLKTYEEITMTDQIPGSQDPYVAFFINEDMDMDISPPDNIRPMEEDTPLAREMSDVGVSDFTPERNQAVPEDRLVQEIPGTEIMRDATLNSHFGNVQELLDLHKDSTEHNLQNTSSSDGVPLARENIDVGVSDFGPSNQAEEFNQTVPDDQLAHEIPGTGKMRDAVHNFESDNLIDMLGLRKDTTEEETPFKQTGNEKEKLSPIEEDGLVSIGQSASFQLHPDPPTTVTSGASFGNLDSHISLGNESLEMAIQPTPQVEKAKPKSRKRKQSFDIPVVLPNRVIKEGLKDASKLVCKRRKLPCSALDVWKFSNRKRMDQIFCQSSISGLCVNLQNTFKKEYVSSKLHQEDTLQELTNATSPTRVPDDDMVIDQLPPDANIEAEHPPQDVNVENEHPPQDVNVENEHPPQDVNIENEHPQPTVDSEIEHLRFNDDPSERDFVAEFMASPSRREEFTPFLARDSEFEPQTGNTFETEGLPSQEQTTPTEPVGSRNMETPLVYSDTQQGMDDTGFSVPRLLNSAEDLYFLEADTTPAGHEDNEPVDTLSVRTRAVARYLKNQSPTTEMSKEQGGNLTLNKILEGKTRKQCARMFFETLVLTSYDLIKVQQDEAYGDITLLITSLAKTKL